MCLRLFVQLVVVYGVLWR